MPPAMHADQNAAMERGCIVQIQGDGNTVVSGLPHLRLTRYRTRRAIGTGEPGSAGFTSSGEREADLLRAYTEAIPFVGRSAERARLAGWLDGAVPISVRVLTGRGGRGKTRLALETCVARARAGWRAGFVTGREMVRFRAQANLAEWGWNTPTLVVLDYAAAFTAPLHAWLAELADNEVRLGEDRPPLRLLLLERHAAPGEGWWADAFGRGGGEADAIAGLLDGLGPDTVDAVRDLAERRAIFVAACRRASQRELDVSPNVDARLAELSWGGEPLFLAMAGLLAARLGVEAALALPPDELAFEQARRELARVRAIWVGHNLPEGGAAFGTHLAALATLRGGLSRHQVHGVIRAERQATGFDAVGDPEPIRTALHDALPGPEGGIAAVEPDPLGEAVILESWRSLLPAEGQVAAVIRAYWEAPNTVATVIVRTCQDFAIHGHHAAASWLQAICAAISERPDHITWLLTMMPEATVELREVAADLGQAWLRHARCESEEERNELAMVLNNLSIRLSDLGRREEALEAAEQAVALYGELAAVQPDAFRPNLAMVLNNLSARLSDLGRREEALEAAEQAVALRRELVSARPDAFRPDLAAALGNFSNRLSDLGRQEEALEAVEQAAALYGELAATRPDAFRPNLAIVLNVLSIHLSELGRREEALKAAERAVALYGELAATRPDAFQPDLALALNALSSCLSGLGRREKALEAVEQAVALYGELAAAWPDAFRPNLAMALNNLSNRLSEVGRREEALEAAEQAVALYGELAAARPDAFRPNLAIALNALSNCLFGLGRWEEALEAAERAVALYGDLAAARPDAFQANLAMVLNNLSTRLSDLGRREEAFEAVERAVTIYRELAQARPDAFRPDLAAALTALSTCLSGLGRREEALGAVERAVAIYRDLAKARLEAFQPNLAMALNNLSNRLFDLGRRKEALEAVELAVAIYRDLAEARPSVFLLGLARSLLALARSQKEASRTKDACASAQEAEALLLVAPFDRRIAPLLGWARGLTQEVC